MKIRIARIIRGEIAVLDDGVAVGEIHKFVAGHEVRLRRRTEGFSVNLLSIEIVSSVVGNIELVFAINSHMTLS